MDSHLPLVSVIVPAYNAEAFILQTLDSVISQTYKNIEILVVDDGSQDRTAEIVESIAQRDHRVILLQQQNSGVAAARNLAIKKSIGEYVAPIDADDIWYPHKLEKQVQCMLQAEPSVGLVYAWSVYIDEEGLPTGEYSSRNQEGDVYVPLLYGNFLSNASTPLIRRVCFERVGGYNCQLKEKDAQGCEDWELYLRIAEYYQFQVVSEFLIGYRQVTGSMSLNYRSMKKSFELVIADARQRHPEIPASIYRWSLSKFDLYLAQKSNKCGDYWSAIFYLYNAVRSDYIHFLNLRFYKMFIKCILKIIASKKLIELVTSLFQPKHRCQSYVEQRIRPNYKVITIADINSNIRKSQQLSWKPYNRIMLKRWSQAAEISQRVSLRQDQKIIDDLLASSFWVKVRQ